MYEYNTDFANFYRRIFKFQSNPRSVPMDIYRLRLWNRSAVIAGGVVSMIGDYQNAARQPSLVRLA